MTIFNIRKITIICFLLTFATFFSSRVIAVQSLQLYSYPFKIGANLNITSQGEQVKILQSALATDKSIYPEGIISGYYGYITKQAVKRFQLKYSLLQTGKVDDITLKKLNEVYGEPIEITPIPEKEKGLIFKIWDFISNPIESIKQFFSAKESNQEIPEKTVPFDNLDITSTDKPIPTVYHDLQPTSDPDPVVNCSIHISCGGGTKLLKNSICGQSTCCQVGDKWYFYTDKNKCKQDQDAYWKVYYSNQNGNTNTTNNNNSSTNTGSTYTPPTYTPPTSTPQNNNANPVPTAVIVQDNSQNINQQEADRISAISRCQGDVRRAKDSSINNLRIQLRAKGSLGSSYFDTEKARVESEALRLMEACKNI